METRSPPEVAARVMEVLASNRVMTLACRDAEGCWAAAVFYAARGRELVFCSSAQSRHVRALAFDDRPAAEIHAEAGDWRSILGLQLSGRVEPLPDDEIDAARGDYVARFPFAGSGADPVLARAMQTVSWFRYRIERAMLIDNANGFGRRACWDGGGAGWAPNCGVRPG